MPVDQVVLQPQKLAECPHGADFGVAVEAKTHYRGDYRVGDETQQRIHLDERHIEFRAACFRCVYFSNEGDEDAGVSGVGIGILYGLTHSVQIGAARIDVIDLYGDSSGVSFDTGSPAIASVVPIIPAVIGGFAGAAAGTIITAIVPRFAACLDD